MDPLLAGFIGFCTGIIALVIKEVAKGSINLGFTKDKIDYQQDKHILLETVKTGNQQRFALKIEPFKLMLQKELEIHKGEVQKNVAQEIEPLKAELAKGNIEYQIHLSQLTAIRLKHIEDLYLSFLDISDYVKDEIAFIVVHPNKKNEIIFKFKELLDNS